MSSSPNFDIRKVYDFLNSVENSSSDSDNTSLYNIFHMAVGHEKYWSYLPLDLKQKMVRIVEYRAGMEGFSQNKSLDNVFFITKNFFQSKFDHVIAPEILEFIRGDKEINELSNENLISLLTLSRIFKIENLDMTPHLNSISLAQINEENFSYLLEAAKNYKSEHLLEACCDFLTHQAGENSYIRFRVNYSGDLTVSLLASRELVVKKDKVANTLHDTLLACEGPFLMRDSLNAFEIIYDKYLSKFKEKFTIELTLDPTVYLEENAVIVNKFLDKFLDSVTCLRINNQMADEIAKKLYGDDIFNCQDIRAKAFEEFAYPISNIGALKNLETLSIKNCVKIENLNFKELKNLRKIETIESKVFFEIYTKYSVLDSIAYPEQIEELYLGGADPYKISEKLERYNNLKKLFISDSSLERLITSAEDVTLANCYCLNVLDVPKATELDIKNCKIEKLTTSAGGVLLADCDIKVLDVPKATRLLVKDSAIEKLTTSAEGVLLSNCNVKVLDVPNAKKMFVKDSIIEKLTTSAEGVNLSQCHIINMDVLKATELDVKNCKIEKLITSAERVDLFDSDIIDLDIFNAKSLYIRSCPFTNLTTSAENIVLVGCHSLKLLDAPKAETLTIHSASIEELNTPAKKVELFYCRELKVVKAIKSKEVVISSCGSVEKLEISMADTFSLSGNRKLKTLNVNAIELFVDDCEGLEILEAPITEKLSVVSASSLKTVKAPLAKKGYINVCFSLEEVEVLFPLDTKLLSIIAVNRLLKPYEIKSIKSETETESAIPEVPELQLKTDGIEIRDFQILEELTNQFIAIDKSTEVELKCGGDVYKKIDLLEVIEQILSFFGDSSQHLNLRKKIYFLLSEFTEKLTLNPDKGGLIRVCVDYKKGGIDLLEKTLELLYRLESMNSMFHQINFDQPNKEGYISPETLKNELKNDRMESTTLEKLTLSFEALLDRIKRQERYLGTPSENAADGHKQLKQYYHNLEQYFQLVTICLENREDPREKAFKLIDIAIASLHCGERWIGDIQQIYSLLSESEGSLNETILEELIKKADTKFKLGIIEKLSYSQSHKAIDVHKYDQYKRLIGMELGIPGSEAFVDVEDIHSDLSLTQELAFNNFCAEYTLRNIVEFLKGQLEDLFESNLRDSLIRLLIDNIPLEWVEKEYGDILENLKSLINSETERDQIRTFLANKGIVIRPDWNANNALEVFIQDMRDSAEFMDLEEKDQEIRLNEMEELRNKLQGLTIDEQKVMLTTKGIPLGRESNPDFIAELYLNYINPDYLESVFIKDEKTGERTKQLNLQAVLPTILFLLEKIGKIGKTEIL